jgi:hypothetical protein
MSVRELAVAETLEMDEEEVGMDLVHLEGVDVLEEEDEVVINFTRVPLHPMMRKK